MQLNDERVSRFHVKIQEDDGRLVLTDLESTNGTRVNGHTCSLKKLANGDTIAIGRTLLLVGDGTEGPVYDSSGESSNLDAIDDSTRIRVASSGQSQREAELPTGLSPGQSAELRELLDFIHGGIRQVLDVGLVDERSNKIEIALQAWQQLLSTQSDLSVLIRQIEDPDHQPPAYGNKLRPSGNDDDGPTQLGPSDPETGRG